MLLVYAHPLVCMCFLLQWGNTALLLAILMNHLEAAHVLIARNAKITTKNKVGGIDI